MMLFCTSFKLLPNSVSITFSIGIPNLPQEREKSTRPNNKLDKRKKVDYFYSFERL